MKQEKYKTSNQNRYPFNVAFKCREKISQVFGLFFWVDHAYVVTGTVLLSFLVRYEYDWMELGVFAPWLEDAIDNSTYYGKIHGHGHCENSFNSSRYLIFLALQSETSKECFFQAFEESRNWNCKPKMILFYELSDIRECDLHRTMGCIMATIENGRNGEASYEKLMMNRHDT